MKVTIAREYSEDQLINSPAGQYLQMTETEYVFNGMKIEKR